MNSLFELLRSKGILARRGISVSAIDSLTAHQIVDITSTVVDQTETVPEQHHTSFTHAAANSLSGARAECEALAHRLTKAEELARFSVMYSDKTYIESFFGDYEHESEFWGEERIKEVFYNDVRVLLSLKPLIEQGFIEIYTPFFHHCITCVDRTLGKSFQRKMERERLALARDYHSRTSVNLTGLDELYCEFEVKAPEPYLDHEMIISENANAGIHEKLRLMPRLMQKLKTEGNVPLANHITRQLDVHKFLANLLIESVSSGMLTSRLSNSSYLTSSPLEVSLLQSLSNEPSMDHRNKIAYKCLTSIVPFVEDIPIGKLIKLRQREEESFIQYRSALNKAIDEFQSRGTSFSEKEARELYSDVIAPRLAALERGIKTAKRDLIGQTSRTILAVAGAISFGLYTGLIPSELAEMAKVLGVTKVGADILEKILQLGNYRQGIQNDSLYFLWKVKRLK
jgi:hypothetical protein